MAKELKDYPEETRKFLQEFAVNAPLQKDTEFYPYRVEPGIMKVSPNGELTFKGKNNFPFLKFSVEGTQVVLVINDKEAMRVETAS